MIVTLSGPHSSFSTAVENVLLFRDNVQHYLQGGSRPAAGFTSIHALADVVVLRPSATILGAKVLWEEMSRAFFGIEGIATRDLAISLRTRAILTNARTLPDVRGTVLQRFSGWGIPLSTFGASTLGDLFWGLVTRVELLTASGTAARGIEVRLAQATPTPIATVEPER
jgi:hypothetical protein